MKMLLSLGKFQMYVFLFPCQRRGKQELSKGCLGDQVLFDFIKMDVFFYSAAFNSYRCQGVKYVSTSLLLRKGIYIYMYVFLFLLLIIHLVARSNAAGFYVQFTILSMCAAFPFSRFEEQYYFPSTKPLKYRSIFFLFFFFFFSFGAVFFMTTSSRCIKVFPIYEYSVVYISMAVHYNKERLSESRRVSLNKWRGWGLDASPNDCHDGIGYNILCLCLLYSTAARRTEKRENSRCCSGNDPICYLDDVPLSSTAYRYKIYIPPCFSHRSHTHTHTTWKKGEGKEKEKS